MTTETSPSLRHHPDLQGIFKAMEGRDPTREELDTYRRIVPEFARRADAAQEVAEVEAPIVRKVIKAVFERYPYEKFHQLAYPKAVRDVRYVCAYGVMCMLMNDHDWYRDKLLIWMKTIIQAFEYPALEDGKEPLFPSEKANLDRLKPGQTSIYECYFMLREEMRKALSPEAYEQMKPYLSLSHKILAHD